MSEELACYAVAEENSLGRRFEEKPHPYRSAFERDRDRIVHSQAFRRLEGKTQVFTPGINDNYRNRLTHCLEVAQIGRTIAKILHLNESLTEAICLAHDLGHSPFGHVGEKILNRLMKDFSGFEHNCQSLRIVDLLEHPYPDFAGLNLMYETRLGLARHHSPYDKPKDSIFTEQNCSLEGQVTDIADRIAYNCHDLEDGMRAGLIRTEQLKKIEIFRDGQERINAKAIEDSHVRMIRTAKAVIDILVSDCVDSSKEILAAAQLKKPDDIYSKTENMVIFSGETEMKLRELEGFLLGNFYEHESLVKTAEKVEEYVGVLFEKLCREPALMPRYFQKLVKSEGLQRAVCDYIAGMTDRFCLQMGK